MVSDYRYGYRNGYYNLTPADGYRMNEDYERGYEDGKKARENDDRIAEER